MINRYSHLGVYSDWADFATGPRARRRRPPAAQVRRLVEEVLSFPDPSIEWVPSEARVEKRWTAEGLDGEELSYSVGYGPLTKAWVLKPTRAEGSLPGVLVLHGHDGFKYFGKEKVADGPEPTPAVVAALRRSNYQGRAFANDLARLGFVVLVPDVFGWGSRRFPLAEMPPLIQELGELTAGTVAPGSLLGPVPSKVETYNAAAWHHENLVEKYSSLLGTTLAAVVAHEDRVALGHLRSRPDTTDRTGSVGLSGGGCRSALLRATSDYVNAAVIVGMMSTYDALLDHSVINHTWMLVPAGFAGHADWPDLAACRAPAPLLVQYNRDDPLFPLSGAESAHERITAHYGETDCPNAYRGLFYDGPHKFDVAMQNDAFTWLGSHLYP
jgi:dienelactone hydrolase